MQEDNWSEKLAEYLRKQQEESPLPYEPGAWEAFEKRRNKIREFSLPYHRIAGIAASLLVFIVAGYFLILPISENETSKKQLSEQTQKEKSNLNQNKVDPGITKTPEENKVSSSSNEFNIKNNLYLSHDSGVDNRATEGDKSIPESSKVNPLIFLQNSALTEKTAALTTQPDSDQVTAEESKTLPQPAKTNSAASLRSEEEAINKFTAQILDGEEDEKEVVKSKKSSIFLGFGPGYANRMQTNMASTGSNLGLALMYDLNVGKMLSVGSGLGVNYFNQTNQSQQIPQVLGIYSPIKESQRVRQLQMDIPIYVRYPLNRDNSVSFQAGFSNLITFNQQAIETVSFTRQVNTSDVSNSSANPSILKTEQVTQTSELKVPVNKFYPFAMANLGINILVYKSQKTNFLVMPFYHYPLQDISGTGQNPGITGAAVKLNFGAVRK